MDITFGLDISHHQDLALDLARVRREGCEFVFLKATEGGSFTDSEFTHNLAEARAAGLLVAAYVFVRANATPWEHVARTRSVVPLDVPLILDIEVPLKGASPSKAHSDACLAAYRAAGYKVPLSYIPKWFWQGTWGSPRLDGWPPLWSSRYPDNRVGTLPDEWDDVRPHYWDGHGGLNVAVLQFTSSARIAGHEPLDANAFRGTRAQLAALLGHNTGGGTPTGQVKENDMERLQAGTNQSLSFDIPAGARELRVNCPEGSVTVHALYFAGDGLPPDNDADPATVPPFDGKGGGLQPEDPDKQIHRLRPWRVNVPTDATNGSIFWSMDPAHPERTGSLSFR